MTITMAHAVRDAASDAPVGVLKTAWAVSAANDALTQLAQGTSASVEVLDGAGRLVASTSDTPRLQPFSGYAALRAVLGDSLRDSLATYDDRGESLRAAAVPANDGTWLVVARQPTAIAAERARTARTLILAAAAVLLVAIWAVLRFTDLGLVARGTMQNPEMAAAVGVNPDRVYAVTFGVGAALTGLAGALIAPLAGVVPTMGAAYIAKAFITVITGGAAILAGTLSAAGLLGAVNTVGSFLTTPVLGEVGLLLAALVLLRLLPRGITGRYFRRAL
jgi:branched-subunit amino acid ABC-type transport system permease component